jgi:hypothetical protein
MLVYTDFAATTTVTAIVAAAVTLSHKVIIHAAAPKLCHKVMEKSCGVAVAALATIPARLVTIMPSA